MTALRFPSKRIGAGLRAGRFGFLSRQGRDIFSLLHSVHTGSGAHPISYMSTMGPGVRRPVSDADHSPLSSAEVMNGGAITPLPHKSSWHGA
jgi:hypothetical protein